MSADQLERLAAGIKAAHAAGNEEHVRRLGAEYRRLQSAQPQQQEQKPDRSIGTTLKAGVDQITEGVADTLEVFGAEGAAQGTRDLIQTPENYDPAAAGFIGDEGEGLDFSYLPRATVEQSPQYAGSIAARGAGAAIGAVAGPLGALAGSFIGPAVFEASQQYGGIVKERAARNDRPDDPSLSDHLVGAGGAIASGALNAVGLGGKSIIGSVVKEGLTEAGQSGIEQTASTAGTEEGFDFSVKQAVGEGILGGTSAGAVNTTTEVANRSYEAFNTAASNIRTDPGDYSQSDVLAMRELIKAADGDPNNPESWQDAMEILGNVDKDVSGDDNKADSAKSAANAALRSLRAEYQSIAGELKEALKASKQGDRADLIQVDVTEAQKAIRKAGLIAGHQKSRYVEAYMDDLQQAMPQYTDDIKKMRLQLEAIGHIERFTTGTTNDMGGISQFSRLFDPFDPRNNMKFTLAGFAAGGASSGVTLAGGVIGNRIAQRIDKLTNNRSRVKRYVDSVNKYAPDRDLPDGGQAREHLEAIKKSEKDRRSLEELTQRLKRQENTLHDRIAGSVNREIQRKKQEQKTVEKQTKLIEQAKAKQEEEDTKEFRREALIEIANRNQPIPVSNPQLEPYRAWEHFVGAQVGPIMVAMEQLERSGQLPQGTLDTFQTDIAQFSKKGKRGKDTRLIQEMVKNVLGTQTKQEPYVSYDEWVKAQRPEEEPDPLALAREAAANAKVRTNAGRKKFLGDEGHRRALILQRTIQAAKDGLKTKEYTGLLQLARRIDSPALTADQRLATVRQVLGNLFRGNPTAREHWTREFADLAAWGNDFEIPKETKETVDTQEETTEPTFKDKVENTPSAANDNAAPQRRKKTATSKKRQDPEPTLDPSKEEQLEFDLKPPAETPAEVALRKLEETPKEAPKEEPSASNEEREKTEPKTVEKKGNKAGLYQMIENRVDKSLKMIADYEVNGPDFADMMRGLSKQHNNRSRVLYLLLDNAAARVTVNQLVEAYKRKFKTQLPDGRSIPLSNEVALDQVQTALNSMVDEGLIKVFARKGNSILRVDDKIKKGLEDELLTALEIEVVDPDLKRDFNTSLSIKNVGKMVSQKEEPKPYSENNLFDGDHFAFKDYGLKDVGPEWKPAFDFLNYMRGTKYTYHPRMLDIIEKAAIGDDPRRKGPISEVLRPPSKDGKPDDGPLNTVAHIILTHGAAADRTDTTTRMEWSMGANLRTYSKNSLAHNQAGDIMKGMIRAAEPSKIEGIDGLNFMFHSFGNLLGADKEAPKDRRDFIFENDRASYLLDWVQDPMNRRALKTEARNGKPAKNTFIGDLVDDSEGFFQALNVALEIDSMVRHAAARFPDKVKKKKLKGKRGEKIDAVALLKDPDVQQDLAVNYQTDFIVQLDASNNAYQLAGLLMGDEDTLRDTGLRPQEGAEDPDALKGADIYMGPAKAIRDKIPELQQLFSSPADDASLRKLFKKPVGTYLYAATFNSRKAAFSEIMNKLAKGKPVIGTPETPGLIQMPEEVYNNLLSDQGHTFDITEYNDDGEVKRQGTKTRRVVPHKGGYRVETLHRSRDGMLSWTPGMGSIESADAAASKIYEDMLYLNMNRELVRDINERYPAIRDYLKYAKVVTQIMKDRGETSIKVPTKDGITLTYSMKDDVQYEGHDVNFGDRVYHIGLASDDVKITGQGLAAFMAHQSDAYVLRETAKRMNERKGLKTFNPIHDSFGFHPADTKQGQETVLEIMQELGAVDYNLFLEILEANGIPLDVFRGRASVEVNGEPKTYKGKLPDRKHVAPVPAASIPTAVS